MTYSFFSQRGSAGQSSAGANTSHSTSVTQTLKDTFQKQAASSQKASDLFGTVLIHSCSVLDLDYILKIPWYTDNHDNFGHYYHSVKHSYRYIRKDDMMLLLASMIISLMLSEYKNYIIKMTYLSHLHISPTLLLCASENAPWMAFAVSFSGLLWPWRVTAKGAVRQNPHFFYLCLVYFVSKYCCRGMAKTVERQTL